MENRLILPGFFNLNSAEKKIIAFFLLMFFFSVTFNNYIHAQVTGRNVTFVSYPSGNFKQVSAGNWQEHNPSNTVFNFKETQRDDWSVYLLDASRNISIQLDLFKKEIYIYWERPNRAKLYNIVASRNDAQVVSNPTPPAPNSSGPADYSKCASENGTYTFNNMVDVAYGADGHFAYKTGVTGTISFNNSYFGDPNPGVPKFGYYKTAANSTQTSNASNNTPTTGRGNLTDMLSNVAPYFSKTDEIALLKWMSSVTADAKVEYCWKQSHPRYTEGLTSCPSGSEKNGELCYPICRDGYYGNGPVCQQNCPSGFRDDNLTTCWKPSAYVRPAGTIPHVSCPSSHPNKQGVGAAAWCDNGPRADFWNLSTCSATISCDGDKDLIGGLCITRCRDGYEGDGTSLGCGSKCPPGMTNTGILSCAKGNYGRGAGSPMKCRDGLIHNGAGLCFEPCPPGYTASSNADPVCWSPCPSNQPIACGAGCASSQTKCAEETWNMIEAVGEMAMNIVTLGETSEFTVAKNSLKTAVKAGDKIAAKAAAKQMVKELATGWENITAKIVAKKLKERFKEDAIKWIAKEYATMLLKEQKQEGFSTDDLWDLAGLDPTGIAEVVHAFYKPVCSRDNPFPNVTALH